MEKFNEHGILDRTFYEDKAKKMSTAQLMWSMKDAYTASKSLKGVSGNGACKGELFYLDEGHVYSDELRKRRNTERKVKPTTRECCENCMLYIDEKCTMPEPCEELKSWIYH